jgi:hypothetical protein
MDAGRVASAQAFSRPRRGSSWLRAAADHCAARGQAAPARPALLISIALPGGWINVPFTSLGDIDAQNEGWDTWKMHPENLLW